MTIYQLIACTIIANDILKASVYFGTEVFRTEILRCVTQFVKQKKCFLIVRFGVRCSALMNTVLLAGSNVPQAVS